MLSQSQRKLDRVMGSTPNVQRVLVTRLAKDIEGRVSDESTTCKSTCTKGMGS